MGDRPALRDVVDAALDHEAVGARGTLLEARRDLIGALAEYAVIESPSAATSVGSLVPSGSAGAGSTGLSPPHPLAARTASVSIATSGGRRGTGRG